LYVLDNQQQFRPIAASVSPNAPIISNAGPVLSTLTVTDDFDITDLNVTLDITHTWTGDLTIVLESPAGTQVVIFDGGADGCSGDNIVDTYDDESANALDCQAGTPDAFPLADYMPSNPLSAFDGESTVGDWILSVDDTVGGDNGTLNSWGLIYDFAPIVSTPYEAVLDANGMITVNMSDLILSVEEACSFTVTTVGVPPVMGNITTIFQTNNGGANGGAVYFDVTVGADDINITDIDINTDEAGAFTMDVYTLVGTYVGNTGSAGPWTLSATGSGTAAGVDLPSNAVLDVPVVLSAGTTYGMALVLDATHGHSYSGTGTDPAPGQTSYSNADVTLSLGSASNAPFNGSPFTPRIFNGNINYTVGTPASTTIDFDCSNLGENLVEVMVTDASGNSATCTATVNVVDQTAPVIVCVGPSIPTEIGMVTDSPALAIVDNTTVTTTIDVTDDFPITDLNVSLDITHTWVSDLQITLESPAGTQVLIFDGGADGCSGDDFSITLDDESANALACEPGPPAFPLADYMPSNALDAFDGESMVGTWTLSIEDTAAGDPGTLNTWGLTYSYEGTPTTAYEIELDQNGMATIDPLDLIADTIEACGISTAAADITEFTCDDIALGVIQVTVFVSDASGNIASCVADVIVVDNLAPVITCPANQSVDPGAGNLFYEVPDYFATGEATAVDNCTDPVTVTTQDPAAGALLPDGTYTVTLTSQDEYGNESTCSFELIVDSLLAVGDNDLNTGVVMYPNPAGNTVNLVNNSNILLEKAVIFDMNGKVIRQIDLRTMQGEKAIDVSTLATGVYAVQITSENATVVKRLIKK